MARHSIDEATDRAMKGDNKEAILLLQKAIRYLKAADLQIIKHHVITCVPSTFKKGSAQEAITELVKTYRYLPS